MLADTQWTMLEPLWSSVVRRAKPVRRICTERLRQSSGATKTEPSGACAD